MRRYRKIAPELALSRCEKEGDRNCASGFFPLFTVGSPGRLTCSRGCRPEPNDAPSDQAEVASVHWERTDFEPCFSCLLFCAKLLLWAPT
jgi:hypothetical protein